MRFGIVVIAALVGLHLAADALADAALCRFTTQVFSDFDQEGNPDKSFDQTSGEVFELRYVDIDLKQRRARLVGNAGIPPVTIVSSDLGSFSFVEVTPAGNITMTTVYDAQRDGCHVAAHSRHIADPVGGSFSQWAGTCLLSPD